jgi:hypothetical protein
MYTVTEWGVSNEPPEIFADRNKYPAKPSYPQDLTNSRDIHMSNKLDYLPIVGFEDADWEKMLSEAKNLEKHYVYTDLAAYIPNRIIHMDSKIEKMRLIDGPTLLIGVLQLEIFLKIDLIISSMTE